MKKPIVITISSISGGGKSVVVKKLAEMLEDAIAIYFDDYETPDTYPKNPLDLMKNGFDFNVIKSPLLAQHLQLLKNGEKVTTPQGIVLSPARFIVYEGPLGRGQYETGQFIDYLVFIDTPLEVGLARRFSRSIASSHYEDLTHEQLIKLVKQLKSFSDDYLLWIRKVYQVQLDSIRPASDLILDWDQTPEALANDIIQAIKVKEWL